MFFCHSSLVFMLKNYNNNYTPYSFCEKFFFRPIVSSLQLSPFRCLRFSQAFVSLTLYCYNDVSLSARRTVFNCALNTNEYPFKILVERVGMKMVVGRRPCDVYLFLSGRYLHVHQRNITFTESAPNDPLLFCQVTNVHCSTVWWWKSEGQNWMEKQTVITQAHMARTSGICRACVTEQQTSLFLNFTGLGYITCSGGSKNFQREGT